MFEVIIAYFNDTWWLVRGEPHLDAILSGEEPHEMGIQIITCESWPAVIQMWEEPEEGKMPWAINPKIIARLKTREHTSIV